MKGHASVIGSHTGLWTMMLGAGVLAVLMLACAGMAAGATWVVDDDGGAGVDFCEIQVAVYVASAEDTIYVHEEMYVENVDGGEKAHASGACAG